MAQDQRPYWMQRRDMKLGKLAPSKQTATQRAKKYEQRTKKDALTAWYELQLTVAPFACENCGDPLHKSMHVNPRTIVCHIVPKRETGGCPSVAVHPLNRWFGCQSCHDVYDKGGKKAAEMPVISLAKERLKKFIKDIPHSERRFIPKFLQ